MSYKISFFNNPFYIQGTIWIVVGSIYSLGWSELFPRISRELMFFLGSTVIIYFLLGFFCQRKGFFQYKKIEVSSNQIITINRAIFILYILLGVEIIFTSCPLFSYIITGKTDYTEFGLPFVHVIIVAGFTIISWFSFHGILSTNSRYLRSKLRRAIILSIVPFILIFNRGGIMAILLGFGLMYLMSRKIKFKNLIYFIIVVLSVFWGFGYFGDKRTDLQDNQHLILELGGASESFKNSIVPPEFFWSYTYITSPLGNIQNNINQTGSKSYSIDDFGEMVLFDFTPRIISKRVASVLNLEERKPYLVVDHLNVCTVYQNSYNYLGWGGLILMFLFSIFFVSVTLGLANRNSPFYVTLLVSVNVIVAMNLFDNMFIFMGLVPIPFFLLLMSRKFKIRPRNNLKMNIRVVLSN